MVGLVKEGKVLRASRFTWRELTEKGILESITESAHGLLDG